MSSEPSDPEPQEPQDPEGSRLGPLLSRAEESILFGALALCAAGVSKYLTVRSGGGLGDVGLAIAAAGLVVPALAIASILSAVRALSLERNRNAPNGISSLVRWQVSTGLLLVGLAVLLVFAAFREM